MFGWFKRQESSLVSVANGKTIRLSDIGDPVFSHMMSGEGIAIIPEDDIILSPADGEISLIFKTKQAFVVSLKNGLKVLVHIGLETVSLNGEGFELLVDEGDFVKKGTPIVKIDRKLMDKKNMSLATPVLIINPENLQSVKYIENAEAIAGKTTIAMYNF